MAAFPGFKIRVTKLYRLQILADKLIDKELLRYSLGNTDRYLNTKTHSYGVELYQLKQEGNNIQLSLHSGTENV